MRSVVSFLLAQQVSSSPRRCSAHSFSRPLCVLYSRHVPHTSAALPSLYPSRTRRCVRLKIHHKRKQWTGENATKTPRKKSIKSVHKQPDPIYKSDYADLICSTAGPNALDPLKPEQFPCSQLQSRVCFCEFLNSDFSVSSYTVIFWIVFLNI